MNKTSLQRVDWINKAYAESIVPDEDEALISIREPAEMVDLADWKHLLEVEFHDIDDISSSSNPDAVQREYVLFDRGMAIDILQFVDSLPPNVTRLTVHCHAGISRSAAVAKAVSELYEVSCAAAVHYTLHNKKVYSTIRKAFFDESIESRTSNL